MKHEDGMHDLALLTARCVLGGSIAAHGAQKLLGWFGGPGIEGTSQMMTHLGFAPGERYARLASTAEIAAGLMIASGAGGPLGPAILLGLMGTAAVSAHLKNGYWGQNQGYELNVMYGLVALLLAVEDHGTISLDNATGIRGRLKPVHGWLALAAGAAGAAYVLAQRTPQQPAMMTEAQPTSEHGTVDTSSAPVNQGT